MRIAILAVSLLLITAGFVFTTNHQSIIYALLGIGWLIATTIIIDAAYDNKTDKTNTY